MEEREIKEIFYKENLIMGRMISSSKSNYIEKFPNDVVVFNANVVTITNGKIWYGDLNLSKDGSKLKKISKKIGEPLFILRERDARFGNETIRSSELIKKAIWNTSEEIPEKNKKHNED